MTIDLLVSNIHCESCAKRVTNVVQKAAPEARTTVDVLTGRVTIEADADVAVILARLEKAGYPATVAG